jgi:hypothetical protein
MLKEVKNQEKKVLKKKLEKKKQAKKKLPNLIKNPKNLNTID